MNVLEHFIKEIHSVRDITEEFKQHSGCEPAEPLLQVDLTTATGLSQGKQKHFGRATLNGQKKKVASWPDRRIVHTRTPVF